MYHEQLKHKTGQLFKAQPKSYNRVYSIEGVIAMSIEKYLSKLESPVDEIARQLHGIIKNHFPEMEEALKWGAPTYSRGKNVCSIIAHKRHVNLQIFLGARIKDAQDLAGTGKDMRHLKFVSAEEIDETRVVKYLRQALEVQG